jgi:hypothetical protein
VHRSGLFSNTPYFNPDDPSLPEDHPKRYRQVRSSGYINSDILGVNSALRAIYRSEMVTRIEGEGYRRDVLTD